jgi:DNA recombination protein RmuC
MDLLALLVALLVGVALGWLLPRSRTTDAGPSPQTTALVQPLAQQLAKVEEHLHALDVARAAANAELRQQVSTVAAGNERLSRETRALVDALRRPQARGRWGELHLRRVVEHAGMLDRCDFTEQLTLPGDTGPLRPDLVVHLPGGGSVVVDAKVTLAAYLEGLESDDERVKDERVQAHARHLRDHVDRLAQKAYWQQLTPAPEFVVLFLPGEAFLAPALEADPSLLEHAMSRRVHLATPTTLLSLLRAVAYGWQQQQLADNAHEVFVAGKELYARLATFGGHVDKLGRSLSTAVNDFNKTVGSLERTVLPSARRMAELGLEGEVPAPMPVTEVTRPLTAPHLVPLPETG